MKKTIFRDESRADRKELLSSNAVSSELFTYHKALNEEELNAVRNNIVQTNIALVRLQEEKDAFNEVHKAKKKPLDLELKENLQIARTNTQEVEEKVYLLANYEDGIMEYYNEEGFCVYERVLLQEERQFRILGGGQRDDLTGTDY